MKKDVILSGIRPTGRLHIGNYFGSLANFVKLQDKYECYFFIADFHSLNESFNPKEKPGQIINLAADYLAAGLNPEKCAIFVQSDIYEHAELAIILSNVIPASYLFRMTQYKEKSVDRSSEKVNSGLLFYPVLMASDILIYKSTMIPVGLDQTQHVELARDAARFFNNSFGQTFPEPKPLYTTSPKIMSLVDPDKKMSKSLGDNHCIYLDETPESISKKIAKAPTDDGGGKSAGGQNLLLLAKIFCGEKQYTKYQKAAKANALKYSELKKILSLEIAKYFENYRIRKTSLLKNPEKIKKILKKGALKARTVAQKTLTEAKNKIGLNY